jgi:hypothetical protein
MTTSPSEPKPPLSRGAELVARLSKIVTAVVERRKEPHQVAKELRTIADWLAGEAPPKQAPKPSTTTKEEAELFAYWQRAFGKPQAKPTPERVAKLRARLRDGYSVQDIKRAFDAISASPFHRGENPNGQEHVDITLICRSGAQLEKYRDMTGGAAPPPRGNLSPDDKLEELIARSADELNRGDNDAYNHTQNEIRRLKSGRSTPDRSEPRAKRA